MSMLATILSSVTPAATCPGHRMNIGTRIAGQVGEPLVVESVLAPEVAVVRDEDREGVVRLPCLLEDLVEAADHVVYRHQCPESALAVPSRPYSGAVSSDLTHAGLSLRSLSTGDRSAGGTGASR